MVNLFFVRERCPLSLSLAGYLMNKGERCVEILDAIQFIVDPNDVSSLCFAASNVDTIIKNNNAKRIFVQDNSQNVSAVTLASLLNELPMYLINTNGNLQNPLPSMFDNFVKHISINDTFFNFNQITSTNEFDEKCAYMDYTLISERFPPEADWFLKYLFYTVKPETLYSQANYFLPNYVSASDTISDAKRLEASKICKFF